MLVTVVVVFYPWYCLGIFPGHTVTSYEPLQQHDCILTSEGTLQAYQA